MFMQQRLLRLSATAVLVKRLSLVLAVATFFIGSAEVVTAGNTVSTTVKFSVEEIAEIEVTGTLSAPLTLTAPEQGAVDQFGDSNTYIRYTSIVPEGKTRTITAAIASGVIPNGCALKLTAVGLSGNGNSGIAVADGVYLSDAPYGIVTGIGNCYTGTGATDGLQVAFTLVVADEAKLVVGETTTVMISFTLK